MLYRTPNQENPFVADSVLQHKADYILTHSIINRTTVIIADPDVPNGNGNININGNGPQGEAMVDEVVVNSHQAAQVQATPPRSLPYSDGDIKHPNSITVTEVHVSKNGSAEPQRAEQVTLKGKGKCCVII